MSTWIEIQVRPLFFQGRTASGRTHGCRLVSLASERQPTGFLRGRRQSPLFVGRNNAHARKIGTPGHRGWCPSFCHFVTDRNRSTEFLNHARQPGLFPNGLRSGAPSFSPRAAEFGFVLRYIRSRAAASAELNTRYATSDVDLTPSGPDHLIVDV